MSSVKLNQPIRSINKTKFNLTMGGQTTEMDFGFPFSAGEILFNENRICLFQDDYELNQPLLGKMFDLQGQFIGDILFPQSPYPSHVAIAFNWCGYHQGNIHINFITDTSSYRDFGVTFDVVTQKFNTIHPVR